MQVWLHSGDMQSPAVAGPTAVALSTTAASLVAYGDIKHAARNPKDMSGHQRGGEKKANRSHLFPLEFSHPKMLLEGDERGEEIKSN